MCHISVHESVKNILFTKSELRLNIYLRLSVVNISSTVIECHDYRAVTVSNCPERLILVCI
jgi:hypothetical protein